MKRCVIDFREMEWQCVRPGLRFKSHMEGKQELRLVEFTDQLCETDWCTLSHVGFMLEGCMTVDFEGRKVTFYEGNGIFVPEGHKHKTTMARGHTAVAVFVEG